VFTSSRSGDVAARFVGYAIFDVGSHSICSSTTSDDTSKVDINGKVIIETNRSKEMQCRTIIIIDAGVKRIVVEF